MSRWQITGSFVLVAVLMATGGQAQATLLTFDDIITEPTTGSNLILYGNFGGVGDDYHGFNFFGDIAPLAVYYMGERSRWPYGAYSGTFALAAGQGGPGKILDAGGADFTFDGLQAKGWEGTTPVSGYLYGYNDGVEKWGVAITLTDSFQHIDAQAEALDELRIVVPSGKNFCLDDIRLNAIPEPTALAIWSSLGGLALIAAARRRRRKQAA